MKKIFLLLIVFLISLTTSAQTLKLYKNGELIKTYTQDEIDELEFVKEETQDEEKPLYTITYETGYSKTVGEFWYEENEPKYVVNKNYYGESLLDEIKYDLKSSLWYYDEEYSVTNIKYNHDGSIASFTEDNFEEDKGHDITTYSFSYNTDGTLASIKYDETTVTYNWDNGLLRSIKCVDLASQNSNNTITCDFTYSEIDNPTEYYTPFGAPSDNIGMYTGVDFELLAIVGKFCKGPKKLPSQLKINDGYYPHTIDISYKFNSTTGNIESVTSVSTTSHPLWGTQTSTTTATYKYNK